jgi:hypothetical protein
MSTALALLAVFGGFTNHAKGILFCMYWGVYWVDKILKNEFKKRRSKNGNIWICHFLFRVKIYMVAVNSVDNFRVSLWLRWSCQLDIVMQILCAYNTSQLLWLFNTSSYNDMVFLYARDSVSWNTPITCKYKFL